MNKKQELLQHAATIIQEEGMQKLTMDYLAKKANITKGGVLYHFNNKDTLIQKMNEMAIADFEQSIEHHISKLSGNYVFTRAYVLTASILERSINCCAYIFAGRQKQLTVMAKSSTTMVSTLCSRSRRS